MARGDRGEGVKGASTGAGDPGLFSGSNSISGDFFSKDLRSSVFFLGDFLTGGFRGEEVFWGRGDFMRRDWLVANELLMLVLDRCWLLNE